MTQWRRVYPASVPGGDVGGDVQVTESYSVRFHPVWQPADGLHAMVTVYFYGAWQPATGFWVEEQVEFLVCVDPSDPGGTEVWSDYRYYDLSDRYPSADAADLAARNLAESTDGSAFVWGGRGPLPDVSGGDA